MSLYLKDTVVYPGQSLCPATWWDLTVSNPFPLQQLSYVPFSINVTSWAAHDSPISDLCPKPGSTLSEGRLGGTWYEKIKRQSGHMTHMTRILGSHGTSSDWENNFFITHFHFYLERQYWTYLDPLQSSGDICVYFDRDIANGANLENYCTVFSVHWVQIYEMSSSVAVWLAASQLLGMHLIPPDSTWFHQANCEASPELTWPAVLTQGELVKPAVWYSWLEVPAVQIWKQIEGRLAREPKYIWRCPQVPLAATQFWSSTWLEPGSDHQVPQLNLIWTFLSVFLLLLYRLWPLLWWAAQCPVPIMVTFVLNEWKLAHFRR